MSHEHMSRDERQELKEAVCDALLERTRRIVSGENEHGAVILGDRPSRILASGFLLPRLNADGDDEASDIRIAAHGLDLRLRTTIAGYVRIRPSFDVYVRALPSTEELFARDGRLIPPHGFSPEAKQHIKDELRRRMPPAGASTPQMRAEVRSALRREIMREMGVRMPGDITPPPLPDEASTEALLGDAADNLLRAGSAEQRVRLQIPDAMSRQYEVPLKCVRVPVPLEELTLPLPLDPAQWRSLATGYSETLSRAAEAACARWIFSDVGHMDAWRFGRVPSEAFWSRAAWDAFIATSRASAPDARRLIPRFDLQMLIDPFIDPMTPEVACLRIAIENVRESDDALECGIFGVSLEVSTPDAALVPMQLERVRRSYHLAGFLSMPAVGVNCGVEEIASSPGDRRLRTTWMPRYTLPRMQAFAIDTVPTKYSALAEQDLNLSALDGLPKAMLSWIADVEAGTRLSWPEEMTSAADDERQRLALHHDIAAWRHESARISRGIDVLVRSQVAWRNDPSCSAAIPYRAWLCTNSSFRQQSLDADAGWRLFQLAFVLAHVPTLASRIPEHAAVFDASFDEDAVSLLYMSTGGGKTEAFFGVIVLGLFLDRMRGKLRGVTAMMHYPLRLLTIQQSQRFARLLARAELVRRDEGIDGAPFEIGFWVGGANTPNRTETASGSVTKEVEVIPTWEEVPISEESEIAGPRRENRLYVAARDAWNKIPLCPFCGATTGLRLFPERHHRLGVLCTATDECAWNRAHTGGPTPEPLPFLLVDTDIYRRAPSVLLGTVDKLALLGQHTNTVVRIAGMFGLARFAGEGTNGLLHTDDAARDLAGVEPVAPAWPGGKEVFFDPFPSLVVQDEMHLLDESLGTFGGIFETGLFAWFASVAPLLGNRACRVPSAPDRARLPHVIGATATAADPAKHVRALYQKHVVQFPHPGPALLNGFYVRLANFDTGGAADGERSVRDAQVHPRVRESAAPWARVYASLMTNGRLHTATTLAALTAHAATVTRWLRDLACAEVQRQARAASEIIASISTAPFSDRRRAAVSRQLEQGRYDRLFALVDLHRIELTYVTNKKGGDQILSAIGAEVSEAHSTMGSAYALDDFRMELISGGVDVKGIQTVIRHAERPFNPAVDDIAAMLRGIVATSAISHGVDVEMFNAMAFAGMPTDIAEYIQASSRVGRTHVGFSLLIPTPQARRDRFVVGVHEGFHRLLERMIAPPAAQRWADRAIERTIPSLVQMWLAGVYHQQAYIAAPPDTKRNQRVPATVDAAASVFRSARANANFETCVAFVCDAIGVDSPVGGPGSSRDYYRNLVRRGVEQIRSELCSDNFTGTLTDFWDNEQNPLRRLRPMMSLRDVDDAGDIFGAARSLKNKALRAEELADAMAFIRNRGVSRGRQLSQSETDEER